MEYIKLTPYPCFWTIRQPNTIQKNENTSKKNCLIPPNGLITDYSDQDSSCTLTPTLPKAVISSHLFGDQDIYKLMQPLQSVCFTGFDNTMGIQGNMEIASTFDGSPYGGFNSPTCTSINMSSSNEHMDFGLIVDSTISFDSQFQEIVLEGVGAFVDIDNVPKDTTLSLEDMPFDFINHVFDFDGPHAA